MIGRIMIMIGMLEVVWPWVVIVVLAPWEIQVIFPVKIVYLRVRLLLSFEKAAFMGFQGPIHRRRQHVWSLKNWTLLKHMVHDLTVSTARS